MRENNKFLKFIAVIIATSFMSSIANAATVTAENSVTYKFDVSHLGDTTFSRYSWGGSLRSGTTMNLYFGSGIGSNELGVVSKTSNLGTVSQFSTNLSPNIDIPAALTTLFVTFVYVDGDYNTEYLKLYYVDGGTNVSVQGSIVPLPAAMPLFAAGLALFGLARRRRKNTAAQLPTTET